MKKLFILVLKNIERFTHRAIKSLENKDKRVNNSVQLTPKEWEHIYITEPKPVLGLTSSTAKALLNLSKPGDSCIEMGCGSGIISAELAIEKRDITLCDFSPEILAGAKRLFKVSSLPEPETILLDISKKLPIPDNKYDLVWSSGVLEHWEDQELLPIVQEMARISRKYVVSFVPNASSLFYRVGKFIEEYRGTWIYGKEIPRESLKKIFKSANLHNISESIISDDLAINWFRKVNPDLYPIISKWWNSLKDDDPVKRNQGYLLVTIGQL
jgi:2-polyprenyl-3-methyl-5-hydroxy-6-metoxy-1,4-benzoquinol methylase